MVMPQVMSSPASTVSRGVFPLTVEELMGMQGPGAFSQPDPEELAKAIRKMPVDPSQPINLRPSREVLLQRKKRLEDFWRPLHERQAEDDVVYKLQNPVEDRIGQMDIGAGEILILNDPWVLVEKVSNMMARQNALLTVPLKDPGLTNIAQKIKDSCYWFRDRTNRIYGNKGNNNLTRAEVHDLLLRGWVTARVMLDPGDSEFPYRYDLFDPITVFPEFGGKGIRYLFHLYRETKSRILSDFGWSNELLTRLEEQMKGIGETEDVEVSGYYDDYWHVLFVGDVEVWSAPHNYGFVPWVVRSSFGPPSHMTDTSRYLSSNILSSGGMRRFSQPNDTRWWGVSIFQGIKDVYNSLNKVASAILTEAMKGPNPAMVIFTDEQGESEGKSIDNSIGATTHLRADRNENFRPVESGFKPSELNQTLQLLIDARNRGSLPGIMYGQGADYMSGFAVNLLQSGSQDLLFPVISAHESFLENVFYMFLRLTAEIYPVPVNMVGTDPETGYRTKLTTLSPEEIKMVGYDIGVQYKNVFPRDQAAMMQTVALGVQSQVIDRETGRGEEFLGLRNAPLINKRIIAEQALSDPAVIKAAVPSALQLVYPELFDTWVQVRQEEQRQAQIQQLMALVTSGGGPLSKNSATAGPSPMSGATPPPIPGMPPSQPNGAPPRPNGAAQQGGPY